MAIPKNELDERFSNINYVLGLQKKYGSDFVINAYKQAQPQHNTNIDAMVSKIGADKVIGAMTDAYRPPVKVAKYPTTQPKPYETGAIKTPVAEEQKPDNEFYKANIEVGKKVLGAVQKVREPGQKFARDVRAGYRQLPVLGVVPNAKELAEIVYGEDRLKLSELSRKGKIIPEGAILKQLGQEEGQRLINEMNRLGKGKLFTEASTRYARGEIGTQKATSTLGIIGEEIANAPGRLMAIENVSDPVDLTINLATMVGGGAVAKGVAKQAITKGLGKEATAWLVKDFPGPGAIVRSAMVGDVPNLKVGSQLSADMAQYSNYLNKSLSKQAKAIIKQVDITKAWDDIAKTNPNAVTGTELKRKLVDEVLHNYPYQSQQQIDLLNKIYDLPTKDFDNIASGWKATAKKAQAYPEDIYGEPVEAQKPTGVPEAPKTIQPQPETITPEGRALTEDELIDIYAKRAQDLANKRAIPDMVEEYEKAYVGMGKTVETPIQKPVEQPIPKTQPQATPEPDLLKTTSDTRESILAEMENLGKPQEAPQQTPKEATTLRPLDTAEIPNLPNEEIEARLKYAKDDYTRKDLPSDIQAIYKHRIRRNANERDGVKIDNYLQAVIKAVEKHKDEIPEVYDTIMTDLKKARESLYAVPQEQFAEIPDNISTQVRGIVDASIDRMHRAFLKGDYERTAMQSETEHKYLMREALKRNQESPDQIKVPEANFKDYRPDDITPRKIDYGATTQATNPTEPPKAEVRFNQNTGYYIPNVQTGDKFRLVDNSIVGTNILNAGNAGFDGSLLTDTKDMIDISIVKSVIKPDGTEIPVKQLPKAELPPEAPIAKTIAPEGQTTPETPTEATPQGPVNATLEDGFPTQRVSPNEIGVRAGDMQFKQMDDVATGTNKEEMLSGEWDEIKGGNLLLWQPKNPAQYGLTNGEKYIVVNGHHRLKLAKENNVKGVDVKILKENDPSAPNGKGYSFEDAYNKGAEINIAEGRGSIYDQVTFIRNQRRIYGENGKTYEKTGASVKERKAFTIATKSEDNTFDAFTQRAINADQAEIIAKNAPNDYDTQAIGVRLAKTGKTGSDLENTMQALKMIESDHKLAGKQLDMFGADNELFKRADDIAGIVKGIKKDISDRILSVKGILKRPKQAGEMGAQLKDAYATEQEVKRLEAELSRWDKWYEEAPDSEMRQRIDKELRDKNLADTSQYNLDLTGKAVPEEAVSVETPKTTRIADLEVNDRVIYTPFDDTERSIEGVVVEKIKNQIGEEGLHIGHDVDGNFDIDRIWESNGTVSKAETPDVTTQPEPDLIQPKVAGQGPDLIQPIRKPVFVTDDEGKIARVVAWQGDKPVVVYPEGEGGKYPSNAPQGVAGQEYEYTLDSWKPATDQDFSNAIKPSGSARMRDLRAWLYEFGRSESGMARWGAPKSPDLTMNPDPDVDGVIKDYAKGISFKPDKARWSLEAGELIHDMYGYFVDRFHPISRITKFAKKAGDIPQGIDPSLLAKRYSSIEKLANQKLFKGTFKLNPDGTLTQTGKGLSEILKPIESNMEDFSAFLAIQKDIEKLGQNIKGTPEQANVYKAYRAIRDKYGSNIGIFDKVADDFRAWERRAMLDELLEIGYLSKTQYDDILASNQYHAPFQRVMDELESRGAIPRAKNIFTPEGKPIHKMKGSERRVIDPLENAVMNTYRITDFVERQRVANATINLRNLDPRLQSIIEEGTGQYEIPVYENGVKKTYTVPKDLHTALKNLDEADMGLLWRFISFPTRVLRAGVTLAPEFWVRNPIRDQFTAFVNAKYGFTPGYDFIKGMFHVIAKDDLYNEWLMAGGDHSMFTSLDRNMSRARLRDVMRGRQKYFDVKHPIDALRSISEFFEKGTRLGVYGRARKGGDLIYKAFHRGQGGALPMEAMREAREATTDFSRRGSQTKALNQLIAFFNANIQGTDKMIRTFKERPIESTIRAISSITIPTLALYAINKDNPRYKELPQWQKDFFWIIIPSDDSPIIRIPKPFELGVLFGTSAERIWQYVEERDPEAMKTFGESVLQATVPGVVPTGLTPYLEAKFDKNLFTKRPLVPANLRRLPPEMQAETYTSETAKALGTFAKYSPMKIDNAIRGYFGGMGKIVTDAADQIIKQTNTKPIPKPSKTPADIPLIRGFIAREPLGSVSESVNKFYREYDKIQQANNAVKKYVAEGNAKKAQEWTKKTPEHVFVSGFNEVSSSMAKIRQNIQAIYDNSSLTPEFKRKKIDELNGLITKQAELALEALKNFKEPEPIDQP